MSKLQSWPSASILKLIIMPRQHCFIQWINHTGWKCNSSFHVMVAAPLCNSVWLCQPCCEPSLLISGMATVNKKEENWYRGPPLPREMNIAVFILGRPNQLCLSNLSSDWWNSMQSQYQTKYAKAFGKLPWPQESGSAHGTWVKLKHQQSKLRSGHVPAVPTGHPGWIWRCIISQRCEGAHIGIYGDACCASYMPTQGPSDPNCNFSQRHLSQTQPSTAHLPPLLEVMDFFFHRAI